MPFLDASLLLADIASGDEKRRLEAANVISELEPDTDVDTSFFVASLGSTDDDVVFWSEIALRRLGTRGCAAIPMLLLLLKREELFLRQAAVKALVAVGPKDTSARAAVFLSFGDPSPLVRREALQACIDLPEHSTDELAAIAAMATDPDEAVSRWSEITLRNIRIREEEKA